MLSIDSCQNRVSSEQYDMTVSRAQVLTHRGRVFFEVIRWQVTSFQMIAGSSLIFFIMQMKYVLLQLKSWFQTDLGSENSASFYRQGRRLLLTFLTMVMRWSRSTSKVKNENDTIRNRISDFDKRRISEPKNNKQTSRE